MVHWINYGLQVEIIVILLLIYGLVMFFRAITNLKPEFKTALFFILIFLVMEIFRGIAVGVLLAKGIGHDHPLWLIYPILGLLGAYLVVLGAKKFLSEIKRNR